ncbi:cryptochrome/photolyase family protein [Rubrolithibacter danxiaensis]|uniref:cryptochrome/photolyase family protein n=1 Tax=Rubrolithibacter danxiaensis TaxID=3390805 RepID=UPI003BF78EB6
MEIKKHINIFWLRRDLRLADNAGLFHALKSDLPVLLVFIFDKIILGKLEDADDSRVTFIHQALADINKELKACKSSLLIKHGTPEKAWTELTEEFSINEVFTNHDYEPYATERDEKIRALLAKKNIKFNTFKDQVIFEKNEILKENQAPYTVYSPYQRKWYNTLQPQYLKSYPSEKLLNNLFKTNPFIFPHLEDLGFRKSQLSFPDKEYIGIIGQYEQKRDFPAIEGTSKISVHLRFGTMSIRQVVQKATEAENKTWLNELIWREFYMMTLWHFPFICVRSFKSEYDSIHWRNNEAEFSSWCEGLTGYPIVDAGMRQLNKTGWMHNRVRMITASFLTKHLLIDWRWGEAYFARKLIDYEQASNVGGWQWAAGCGNDAVPYFRIFNPSLQTKKFDPDLKYIKRWIPEYDDPFSYPAPIVDHQFARERALKVFASAVKK